MTLTPSRRRSAIDLEQPVRLGQRQARGRLVHDDDARIERERLGDLHHLPLRDRQVLDQVVRARNRRRAAPAAASRAHASPAVDEFEQAAAAGSRPMNTFAATSRFSNRFSS